MKFLIASTFLLSLIAFDPAQAAKCPLGDLELKAIENKQLRLNGFLETPHPDYTSHIEVYEAPEKGRRKTLWAKLHLTSQKDENTKKKITLYEIDLTFDNPGFENLGLVPSIRIKKDYGWGEQFLIGKLPENLGDSTCLRGLSVFEDGRRIDGNGLFLQHGH